MLKKILKYSLTVLSILILFVFVMANIPPSRAQMGGGIATPGYFKKSGNSILFINSLYELFSVGNRGKKAYLQDLDVSGIFTLGGTVDSGGIDMDGQALIWDADGDLISQASSDDYLDLTLSGASVMLINAFTTPAAIVMNDRGADQDFRVEGDTADSLFFVDASSDTVEIGDGGTTNYASFSSTGALTYNGTARPTRYLTPEIGAVAAYADGTNNDGDVTVNLDTTNHREYARFTSANAVVQDYDLVWQIRLPNNFSAFSASNSISVDIRSSDFANTTAALTLYDGSGNADTGVNGANINPSADNTWQTKNDQPAASYSAGDWVRLQIKLGAGNSDTIDIARISISYLSTN